MKIFINVLIYQSVWFLAILLGNKGALIGVALLLAHLTFSRCRVADLKMMGFLLFLGLLVDGTLHQIGFYSFNQPGFPIPFWLMIIWMGLSITPHHSLEWMKQRLLLASFFGALGGPTAYWAGTRMGAATFNWSLPTSLLILAVLWSFLFPVIMLYSTTAKQTYKKDII